MGLGSMKEELSITHFCHIFNRKKPNTRQELNPQYQDHEACARRCATAAALIVFIDTPSLFKLRHCPHTLSSAQSSLLHLRGKSWKRQESKPGLLGGK